jgi:dsDNA-specific endonuclease/ATPase MutS2
MVFKIGDKVRLLNEVGEGIITEIISSDQILVETTDGMAFPYHENDLLKVNDDDSVTFKKREPLEDKTSSKSKRRFIDTLPVSPKKTPINGVYEIDLHIEELVDEPGILTPTEMLNIQLIHFRECLNEAIAFKISRLVVIHGVGEGVLKREIRTIMRDNYPAIEYQDGNARKYGFGATEITIRNLHK